MIRLFIECAIRAALIVAGTALVLYALRVKVASVKHRVWTGVLLLMLALPAWTAWGPKAELRLLPASVQRFANQPITPPAPPAIDTAQPIAAPAQAIQPRHRLFATTEEILLGIYLLGAALLLTRLMIGTIKARHLIHQSLPCENLSSRIPGVSGRGEGSAVSLAPPDRAAPDKDGLDLDKDILIRTTSQCAAPVTVGCFRPAVILPEHWSKWPRRQLDVVLAHEGAHVRRRDPLVQWLSLFNRAVFWFHPAAWWLERELSALAEEACDAAVIAQGHDPGDYAEVLMNIARDVMDSGSRIHSMAVAMPGPRLPHRIRCIFDGRSFARISPMRTASAIAACVVLSAALLAVTLARGQETAPDWEKAAGGKMAFDVASVKLNAGSRQGSDYNVSFFGDRYPENGGLYSATNSALSLYVAFAYKLDRTQFSLLDSEMPKWASAQRFDIQARAPASTTKDQMRLMMQSLLADRFQLKAHFEMRDTQAYALELVKAGVTGPKLRPHTEDPPCADGSPMTTSSGSLVTTPSGFPVRCGSPIGSVNSGGGTYSASYAGRNVSMQTFAESFDNAPNNPRIDRPVIDRTGLTGNYDFIVKYWPQQNSATPPPDDAPPILFEALKHDLGLKLEPTTAPFNRLIIDHIEEPTPN